MAMVHSLLAIYGALDELVIEAGPDSDTAEAVERYLPGTTGANAGWSREIANFLDMPPGELPPFRNVAASLDDIRRSLADSGSEALTPSEMSRLAFVLGALSNMPDTGQIAGATIIEGLELVVPSTEIDANDAATRLFHLLQERFAERGDWTTVMSYATERELIDERTAQVPLCHTRVKRAHGQTCVVLTTDFTLVQEPGKTIPSLDDLKSVVHPLNWHRCLPFFYDMCELTPGRSDGWDRVLEITSATRKAPFMKTPLKYWLGPAEDATSPYQPLEAWVNYELDDTPGSVDQHGDGLLLVDEGFIKMYSMNVNSGAPGIRVVTKKVVCFRYLSEVAIAILACVSGYANQGVDMLLNGIDTRTADDEAGKGQPSNWKDWSPSATKSTAPDDKPVEPGGDSIPPDADRPSRRAVEVAADMLTDCMDDFSTKSTAIAGKWATGNVPITESIALSAEFAARIATDPWRYWERLRDDRRGGT